MVKQMFKKLLCISFNTLDQCAIEKEASCVRNILRDGPTTPQLLIIRTCQNPGLQIRIYPQAVRLISVNLSNVELDRVTLLI